MPDCLSSEMFFFQHVEYWQKKNKNEVKLLWCLANVASDWRSRTALTAAGFLPQDSPGTQRFEVKDLLQDFYIVVLWVLMREFGSEPSNQGRKSVDSSQVFQHLQACLAAGICINTQKSLKKVHLQSCCKMRRGIISSVKSNIGRCRSLRPAVSARSEPGKQAWVCLSQSRVRAASFQSSFAWPPRGAGGGGGGVTCHSFSQK